MIDYDKLKLAHELALQTSYVIEVTLGVDEDMMDVYIRNVDDESENYNQHLYAHTMDDLIAKLHELAQPKAKYEEGAEVWFVVLGINWTPIQAHTETYRDGKYYVAPNWYREEELYPTKSALIESQIEYWETMRAREYENDVTKECQHESDGKQYTLQDKLTPDGNRHLHHNKCLKCGEFYR